MENGQLVVPRNNYSYRAGDNLVRLESTCRYFRPVYGHRCNFWKDDWNNGESFISVCAYVVYTGNSVTDRTPTLSAYPTSGIFAVCQPDVPCITPGTYAFLGAAAALR